MSSVTLRDAPPTMLCSIKSGESPKRSSFSSAASAIATSATSSSASSSSSSVEVSAAAIPVISGNASSAVAAVSRRKEEQLQNIVIMDGERVIYRGKANKKTERHGHGTGEFSGGVYIGAWENNYPNGRGTYIIKTSIGETRTIRGIWKSKNGITQLCEDGSKRWEKTHSYVPEKIPRQVD